ncbi:hypothetical protein F5Y16DRAFT_373733 [Xylariaceae sp. FL0255]|nr:hypothetical protein F5Y16DRAFT_373733 [Xylariaceae sp. FL0255]
MQLASRALPVVKFKRAIHPSPLRIPSQPCAGNTRCFSISSTLSPYALSNLDARSDGRARTPSLRSSSHNALFRETRALERWRYFLVNPAVIARESDFFRSAEARRWFKPLLVDLPDNSGDFSLWSCLLEYQMRIRGDAGVMHIWRALWGRKALYGVEHPHASTFWRIVLNTALRSKDETMLGQVWVYSEWMYDNYKVQWPHLYTTIMTHMLQTRQHQRALQWHVRLAHNFHPGPQILADLIKRFILDEELHQAGTLQAIYFANQYHNLYDTIIPYLFNIGKTRLARHWRLICSRLGDGPSSPIFARPFIRYLKAYYPDTQFTPEELAAAEMVSESPTEDVGDFSREMVNRVQGKIFGIKVKNYNDNMGAKWFATSWVSLDTAMSTVAALGIEKIGPLSLQSIGLREKTSEGLLKRLEQLKQNGVTVVDSNYVQVMIYIATIGDDELLLDLLESDLHPDVFDDVGLQTQLIESMTKALDSRNLKILLVSRIIAVERSAQAMANSILRSSFMRRDKNAIFKVLHDMKLRQVPIEREQVQFICDKMTQEVGTLDSLRTARYYTAIFCELAWMDIPVPIGHWRMLLLAAVQQGWLDDFEKLSLHLVDLFTKGVSSRPGFMPVHIEDVPETMARPFANVENLLGLYIPQDLPPDNPHHPVRKLFDGALLRDMSIVLFRITPGHGLRVIQDTSPWRRHHSQASQIHDYFRLLRKLHDRGVDLPAPIISQALAKFFRILYGPALPEFRAAQSLMASNTLPLPQMKNLIDEGWADGDAIELLPPVPTLESTVLKKLSFVELNMGPQRSLSREHRTQVPNATTGHKISGFAGP